jgi:hypothetical protein
MRLESINVFPSRKYGEMVGTRRLLENVIPDVALIFPALFGQAPE